jgi:O-methyltransferase
MLKNLLYDAARNFLSQGWVLRNLEAIDAFSENRFAKRGMISQAVAFAGANSVAGDYFEFGLARGEAFLIAHRMRRRYHLDQMKLFGFDSFEGLPEIDDAGDNVWSKGQYACSEDELRKILRRGGMRPSEYELIKGYYDRSLNAGLHERFAGHQAAIVYIDCDLYSSTKLVLNFLSPYLVDGSIVCFDDYYCYKGNPDQGEQKALSEFLQNSNEFTFIPWTSYFPLGKSFIVRLRAKGEGAMRPGSNHGARLEPASGQ